MQTRGESQGTEQSSCIREMNDSAKEKAIARSASIVDNSESLQFQSQATPNVELRRSSRAKFAPIPLVLSGGNSKTYWPPSAVSTSRTSEVDKSSLKDVLEEHSEISDEVKRTSRESNPLKNIHSIGDHRRLSQESSEDDRAVSLPSSQQSSMMLTRFKRSRSPSTTTAETFRPKRGKGVADLDEPTLMAFKDFLKMHKFDCLDEDEVIGDTLMIVKAANEKTRSMLSEVKSDAYGSDDESIFEICLQVEETHAIGQDFLREITTGIGQTTSGPTKKSKVDINKVMVDQKTVGWIRRATGLHRNTGNTELTNKYSTIRQEPKSETSIRIATRRIVNDGSRSSKKQNRGLDVMADAIEELEKDFGTHFPVYRFRSSPPKKKVSRHSSDGTMSRRKVDSKKHRHPRKKVRHYKVKKPTPRICTSLLVLDETWRLQTKPSKYIGRITETGIEFQNRLSIPLHPQFVKAGIIHRPPAMNSVMRNYSHLDYKNSVAPFSSQSCSDEDTLDDKLTCLEGPPAQFAKYEYFYCDLDVEWYRENVIATTLGLPLDAHLSHAEWKSIRRRCKLVPRRFSKKFIASELMERNEYRNIIRLVQRNPQLCPSKFRYNVYKPILPGTSVKACCKIHRTIQPGTVLSYDPTNATYLIEFDNEKFGYEYCPDTDVASCGRPIVQFHKCVFNFHDEVDSCSGQLQDVQLRSPLSVQQIDLLLGKLAVGMSRFFATDNCSLSFPSKKFLEETANRDAFLTLMEVIDTAAIHKANVLSLIADANTLAVGFLPFGDENDQIERSIPSLSKATQDYLVWLHENLGRTNQVLSVAINYFQSLYGSSLFRALSVTQKDEFS